MRIEIVTNDLTYKGDKPPYHIYDIGWKAEVIGIEPVIYANGENSIVYLIEHDSEIYRVAKEDANVIEHTRIIDWEQREWDLFTKRINLYNWDEMRQFNVITTIAKVKEIVSFYKERTNK